jgi:hypothetical protein
MIRESEVLTAMPLQGLLPMFLQYGATCTDANTCYHIAGGLSILTQTAPMNLHVNFGTPMYANLFSIVVGPSSVSRKSAAIGIARNLIDEALPGAVGEVPGSEEGLVEALREKPRQLICYSEFGSFLAKTEEGYLLPLKTRLNEAWDCSPLGRALAKRRAGPVNNPRLSILAGSTPGYLERHTEPTDWLDGFMARWLTFMGERERTYPMPMEDKSQRALCVNYIQQLAARPGVVGPFAGLTPTAQTLWDAWYKSTHASMKNAAHEAAGQVARAPSFALKIAMLLCWDYGQAAQSAITGNPWKITPDELEPAIAITELHLRSVMAIGEGLAEDRDMRARRQVLMSIGDTATHMGEIFRRSKLLKRRAVEIIDTLLEEGLIVRENVDGSSSYFRRVRTQLVANQTGSSSVQSMGSSSVAPVLITPATSATPLATVTPDDDVYIIGEDGD